MSPEDALLRHLDQLLWRNVIYPTVTFLRSAPAVTPTPSSDGILTFIDTANDELTSRRRDLAHFSSFCFDTYDRLLSMWSSSLSLSLSAFGTASHSYLSTRLAARRKPLLPALTNALIAQGDLLRYGGDSAAALARYECAALASPRNGHAHHLCGVAALSVKKYTWAAFRFAHAVMVKSPYLSGKRALVDVAARVRAASKDGKGEFGERALGVLCNVLTAVKYVEWNGRKWR